MGKLIRSLILICIPVGVCIWFVFGKLSEDPGISIVMAFGHAEDETIKMELVVDIGMARRDKSHQKGFGPIDWNKWIRDHFVLRDAAGERMPIQRIGQSGLIPSYKVAGAPEFYLRAILTQQAEYTLDYIPLKHESKLYRRTFSAPVEETEVKRLLFKVPKDEKKA